MKGEGEGIKGLKKRSDRGVRFLIGADGVMLVSFDMFLRAIFCCLALMGHAWAGSPVTVRVDMEKQIRTIPEDFCGLSYETKMLLPNTNTGKHYFRGDNLPLITAFKTMGIKHLRVGGNTAERATVNIPDETDIDALFAFAKAPGKA